VANAGAARFAAAGRDVTVAAGTVTVDGAGVAPVGGALACGNGQLGAIPVPATSGSPSPDDATSTSPDPSDSPSPSASPSAATSSPAGAPTKSPTKAPTGPPPTTAGPPPKNQPPAIVGAHLLETLIAQLPPKGLTCLGQKQPSEQIAEGVYVSDFTDPDDPIGNLRFGFTWKLDTDGTSGAGGFQLGDGIWAGSFLVPYAASHTKGGTVTVDIFVTDPAGNRRDVILKTALDACVIRG
jgi:hypothetical protein